MVTQVQIARKLGISRQLVTFALAGYPQVAAASRQRILDAAQRMGYRPNPHARALKQERTGIAALWIPDQISTHYTHVARALNRLARLAGHELIISEVGSAETGQILSHVPVDGIFAVDTAEQARAHLKSTDSRVPVISMGAECCETADFVRVDLEAGTQDMMRHLIGSGFRRIVHATFMRQNQPGATRRTGYAKAMMEAGLKPEFLLYPLSEQQRAIVRRQIRDFIRARGRPDAVFCHSDDVAIGLYRGLADLDLRVPGDVALAGCDGIQDTEYLECPLTTLVQPVAEMCATAWEFLQRRLERPGRKRQWRVLMPELAVRESSSWRGPVLVGRVGSVMNAKL
jgi:LacI family transcriptional regulator, galactose operon repressor